ncbi:hypothetical protein WG66_014785, partial [Moniliophthora roreri]
MLLMGVVEVLVVLTDIVDGIGSSESGDVAHNVENIDVLLGNVVKSFGVEHSVGSTEGGDVAHNIGCSDVSNSIEECWSVLLALRMALVLLVMQASVVGMVIVGMTMVETMVVVKKKE